MKTFYLEYSEMGGTWLVSVLDNKVEYCSIIDFFWFNYYGDLNSYKVKYKCPNLIQLTDEEIKFILVSGETLK